MRTDVKGFARQLAAPALLVVICAICYLPYPFDAVMGDDLNNLRAIENGQLASNLWQALFGIYADKYRPVFHTALGGLYRVFGYDIHAYVMLNTAVHALNAVIAYQTMRLVARNSTTVAFVTALGFAVSTFALYQVWQVTGLVEGLATGLFLASIYFFVSSWKLRKRAYLWLSVACWAACILSHERYLAFMPVLALAAVLWPADHGKSRLREAAPVVAAVIAVAMVNIGYKNVFGTGSFLVGTGGTALDFDIGRIVAFLWAGLGNVLGFNIGPTYLSGEDLADAPPWVLAVSTAMAALLVGPCVLWAVTTRVWTRPQDLLIVGLWASAFGIALLTASITIRQEFRWLLAPLILLLAASAFSLARLPGAAARIAASVILAGVIGAHAMYYRSKDLNVFFIRGQREIDHAYDLLSRHPTKPDTLYLLVESERDQCGWYYMGGAWFDVHMPEPPATFECVANLDEFRGRTIDADDLVISAKSSTGEVREVTDAVRTALAAQDPDAIVRADLFELFPQAKLNSYVAVSTPSGKGVFSAEAWPTALATVRAVIVITGFNITYPKHRVGRGERLTLQVAMPYASDYPAVAWVDVIAGRDRKRVWQQSLTPPADNVTTLLPVSQSLDVYAGRDIQIVLGLDTPAGDASGHWGVFAEPRIVFTNR